MPLPAILLTSDSFEDWFDATNNLISHVGNTAAYVRVYPNTVSQIQAANLQSTGNAVINGTASILNLITSNSATFQGSNAVFSANVFMSGLVDIANRVVISGAASTLTVAANATFGSRLQVGSTARFVGNVEVTGNSTFTGDILAANVKFTGKTSLAEVIEKATLRNTSASGTINFDILTSAIVYYTSASTGNWTINLRGSSSVPISSLLPVGECITFTLLATQGATGYYQTAFQIDGTPIIPKWQNGFVPVAGSINAVDIYTYSLVRTSSGYSLFGAFTKFA